MTTSSSSSSSPAIATMDGGGRDWSLLPPELLHVISETLTDICDHVLFRSVCPTWRAAAAPIPPHPRHHPWVLLISDNSDRHVITPLDPDRQIYSLRTPSALRMPIGKSFGSPFGLLLVINDDTRSISVVDPLPGGRWSTLPPLFPQPMYCQLARILSVDPHLVLIALLGPFRLPFIWRKGDDQWTVISKLNRRAYDILVLVPNDIALHNGKFFIVDDEKTYVLQSSSKFEPICSFSCPKVANKYVKGGKHLVESSSGNLLMVILDKEDTWMGYVSISVFRLVGTKWEQTKSIGEDSLLLDADNVKCLPSGRLHGYKANCVYVFPYALAATMYIYDIAMDLVTDIRRYATGPCKPLWVSNVH